MNYRQKPRDVYATQWLGIQPNTPTRKISRLASPAGGRSICFTCGQLMSKHGFAPAWPVDWILCPGDWLIEDQYGDTKLVKAKQFNELYEPIK